MVTASADDTADDLLDRVRHLEPQQLLRLAALWAGVRDGAIDGSRQKRRLMARMALRVRTGGGVAVDDPHESSRAADAVQAVLAGAPLGGMIAMRGPAADAAFAIGDALDAVRNRHHLSPMAYEELLRPWRALIAELDG